MQQEVLKNIINDLKNLILKNGFGEKETKIYLKLLDTIKQEDILGYFVDQLYMFIKKDLDKIRPLEKTLKEVVSAPSLLYKLITHYDFVILLDALADSKDKKYNYRAYNFYHKRLIQITIRGNKDKARYQKILAKKDRAALGVLASQSAKYSLKVCRHLKEFNQAHKEKRKFSEHLENVLFFGNDANRLEVLKLIDERHKLYTQTIKLLASSEDNSISRVGKKLLFKQAQKEEEVKEVESRLKEYLDI